MIVPDCRGHGKSSNPGLSYSFKELAADAAALIRALGFKRAHVVGHSNGGNVALVVLMEHPEVVQTVVLQAANAYVSPDLVEKEPPLFDPDRVRRENPGWMNEMIALHSETHGTDYWRDLLLLTVHEIITEPNYTAEALARVRRPALVVQGEKDRVNAPARHAQFIAENIPFSELWLPPSTGHTVHAERLFEWVERVEDFFDRRGDDASDALYRLKSTRYSDERGSIFEVVALQKPEPHLAGRVLTEDQLVEASACAPGYSTNNLNILLNADTPWALVNRSVHNLRREPRSLAERLSQALLGEALRLLERRDEWCLVRAERDGYMGWIPDTALLVSSSNEVKRYQDSCTHIVQAELASAFTSPPKAPGLSGEEAGKLPFGVSLPVTEETDGWSCVRLPDGRAWWVASTALIPLSQRPRPEAAGIAVTLALIRRFTGVPYLWGGRSPYGYDCSGLAQTFWGFMGVQIPRDADQQCRTVKKVTGKPKSGDLLFFGEASGGGHRPISHVAISLGGDEMIHANGAAWGVSSNSLDPASSIYRAWLADNLVCTGRPEF